MPVTGFYALAIIAVIGVAGPSIQRLVCGRNEARRKPVVAAPHGAAATSS